MANSIDAAMPAVEPAARQPFADRAAPDPEIEQLPSRDVVLLEGRHFTDQLVDSDAVFAVAAQLNMRVALTLAANRKISIPQLLILPLGWPIAMRRKLCIAFGAGHGPSVRRNRPAR
jgi:hypothetical protein